MISTKYESVRKYELDRVRLIVQIRISLAQP